MIKEVAQQLEEIRGRLLEWLRSEIRSRGEAVDQNCRVLQAKTNYLIIAGKYAVLSATVDGEEIVVTVEALITSDDRATYQGDEEEKDAKWLTDLPIEELLRVVGLFQKG